MARFWRCGRCRGIVSQRWYSHHLRRPGTAGWSQHRWRDFFTYYYEYHFLCWLHGEKIHAKTYKQIGDNVTFVRSQPGKTDLPFPILMKSGFWKMAHEARTDWAMLLGALFLLIVGAGAWSFDAALSRKGEAEPD